MKISKSKLGIFTIKPDIYYDNRGYFYELYIKNKYDEFLNFNFVQDNISCSKKRILRGLHYQTGFSAQGKLIQVLGEGKIFDVAVDINICSPTYGHWESNILNNKVILFVPPGFAHGFQVISKEALVMYKVTDYYNKDAEKTIIWNDKTLNINWPIKNPIISDKDSKGIEFKNI